MNCLEYRRISLSEPGTRSQNYLAHRAECEDCARYADGVGALDESIMEALCVPVPSDLASRIRLRQVMQDERVSKRLSLWHYAVAASLFLAIALGGVFGYRVYTTSQYVDRLSVAAVDHTMIERQENHFVAPHFIPQLQQQRFKQVLAAFGGKVMDDALAELGPIVHVQVCALSNVPTPVAHFLIRGETGMITVYYVMGRKLSKPESFIIGDFKGMLIPVGRGNMAIVSDPGENLEPVAHKLERALIWI